MSGVRRAGRSGRAGRRDQFERNVAREKRDRQRRERRVRDVERERLKGDAAAVKDAAPPKPKRSRIRRAPMSAAEAARVRRKRERRVRVWKARLRLALLVGLAVGAVVVWRVVPGMEALQVRQIEVEGSGAVSDLTVRGKIDRHVKDTSIFSVDKDAIRRDVKGLPFVRSVEVDRHLPSGVTVRLTEYEPIALAIAGGGGWLVSRDGRALVSARVNDWRDSIPVVRLDAKRVKAGQRLGGDPSLQLLRAVPATFPGNFRTVESTDGVITGELLDGITIQFGRAEELTVKLAVAERLLALYGPARRGAIEYIDVTVPARPAVRAPEAD